MPETATIPSITPEQRQVFDQISTKLREAKELIESLPRTKDEDGDEQLPVVLVATVSLIDGGGLESSTALVGRADHVAAIVGAMTRDMPSPLRARLAVELFAR